MTEDPNRIHHTDLVIDEIRDNPSGRDDHHLDEEYVTFKNDGTTPLDISGWVVENERGETFHLPGETVVEPGKRITIHSGRGQRSASDLYWGAERPIWRNAGDTVFVRDGDGQIRIRVSYNE